MVVCMLTDSEQVTLLAVPMQYSRILTASAPALVKPYIAVSATQVTAHTAECLMGQLQHESSDLLWSVHHKERNGHPKTSSLSVLYAAD